MAVSLIKYWRRLQGIFKMQANTSKPSGNYIVMNSQVLFHDGTLLHSKSQYTIVKHIRQLLEHTYRFDPHLAL
jgi:hypothetical protein